MFWFTRCWKVLNSSYGHWLKCEQSREGTQCVGEAGMRQARLTALVVSSCAVLNMSLFPSFTSAYHRQV